MMIPTTGIVSTAYGQGRVLPAAVSHPLPSVVAHSSSHPSWWSYAAPDATALVGIQWQNLQHSPFADAVAAELWNGTLGLPAMDCLKQVRQIVLSSPPALAIEAGTFPPEVLKAEAQAHGFRAVAYKGATLWVAPESGGTSIAQLSEAILLLGSRKTLEAAIDNSLVETGRKTSPLLARAAQFSQADLWVVSSALPDPLANVFVPIDTQARGFDGSVSLHAGLNLEASLDAGSYEAAVALAKNLRENTASLPAVAKDLKIGVEENAVRLWLRLTPEELAAGLRKNDSAKPVEATASVPAPVPKFEPSAAINTDPPPAPKPGPKPVPQVIRILGLDDGPREIPFPPSK